MPNEWKETFLEANNDVDTMMKLNCPTVDQKEVSFYFLPESLLTTTGEPVLLIRKEIQNNNLGRRRRDLVSLDDILRASERYNKAVPEEGVKQITTGFRKWAERYLGNCSGQRNYSYQMNRMNRWNAALQDHLENHPNRPRPEE